MNSIRTLFKKGSTKNFSVMAGYRPEDINKEYEDVGHDLNDMALNIKEGFNVAVGATPDSKEGAEADRSYVNMYFCS